MKVELDEIGAEIEIRGDIKDKEGFYLSTAIAKYDCNGDSLPSGSFYLTMPIKTAEALLEKLSALFGKVEVG